MSTMLESAGQVVSWTAATIGPYCLARALHRRWPRWWTMPILVAPGMIILLVLGFQASYRDYIGGAGWLLVALGPVTVAFAVPIYEHRVMIRRRWMVLLVGMVAGSVTSVATAWALAGLLRLDGAMRLSLLPRSISMPFALEMSGDIGGVPDLTAVFVVLTGLLGAVVGDGLLAWLPIRTAMARGALLGMGAHGMGAARAHAMGREEGTIAGLVMVLVGLLNVLVAPLVAHLLR
jgi:predicted murein hydrolase (TIGR00659 family)